MHIETEKTRNTGVKRVVYKLLLNLIRIVQILFAKPVNRFYRVKGSPLKYIRLELIITSAHRAIYDAAKTPRSDIY